MDFSYSEDGPSDSQSWLFPAYLCIQLGMKKLAATADVVEH